MMQKVVLFILFILFSNCQQKQKPFLEKTVESNVQLSTIQINCSVFVRGCTIAGKKEGMWLHYNEKGQVVQVQVFNRDTCVSSVKDTLPTVLTENPITGIVCLKSNLLDKVGTIIGANVLGRKKGLFLRKYIAPNKSMYLETALTYQNDICEGPYLEILQIPINGNRRITERGYKSNGLTRGQCIQYGINGSIERVRIAGTLNDTIKFYEDGRLVRTQYGNITQPGTYLFKHANICKDLQNENFTKYLGISIDTFWRQQPYFLSKQHYTLTMVTIPKTGNKIYTKIFSCGNQEDDLILTIYTVPPNKVDSITPKLYPCDDSPHEEGIIQEITLDARKRYGWIQKF